MLHHEYPCLTAEAAQSQPWTRSAGSRILANQTSPLYTRPPPAEAKWLPGPGQSHKRRNGQTEERSADFLTHFPSEGVRVLGRPLDWNRSACHSGQEESASPSQAVSETNPRQHLTPAQRRSRVIADNQLAIAGAGWDEEMLRLELVSRIRRSVRSEVSGFAGFPDVKAPRAALFDVRRISDSGH